MDDRLQRLLDAEARAQALIDEASRERQRTLRELAARHEVEAAEAALALLLDPDR